MYLELLDIFLTIANIFFCFEIADTLLILENEGIIVSPLLATYIIKSLFTTYVVYGDSIQFMIFSVFNSIILIITFIALFHTLDS